LVVTGCDGPKFTVSSVGSVWLGVIEVGRRPMPVEDSLVDSWRTPALKWNGMPAISVLNCADRKSAQVRSLMSR
jgi:hypothetical protein